MRFDFTRKSASSDITSGRVHLDVCWIDLPASPMDCSKRCSSIHHTSSWTRPLVMSDEVDFPNGL